jgi:hypothetical protein
VERFDVVVTAPIYISALMDYLSTISTPRLSLDDDIYVVMNGMDLEGRSAGSIEILSRNFLGGTKEHHERPHIRLPDRDMKPPSPKESPELCL